MDPTIVTDLGSIESSQAKGTEAVFNTCHQLFDYVSTHHKSTIQYHESDMILALDTDTSYLSEQGGKTQAAAYMFLTNKNQPEFYNGAILVFLE